jgi:hypothetical protein
LIAQIVGGNLSLLSLIPTGVAGRLNHLIALIRDVITKAIGSLLALLKQKYHDNSNSGLTALLFFSQINHS